MGGRSMLLFIVYEFHKGIVVSIVTIWTFIFYANLYLVLKVYVATVTVIKTAFQQLIHGNCLATKDFIGKLPATRGVWVTIG